MNEIIYYLSSYGFTEFLILYVLIVLFSFYVVINNNKLNKSNISLRLFEIFIIYLYWPFKYFTDTTIKP